MSDSDLLIKALLFGLPGSGKTSLAATAANHPKMAKVLFLSIEGGMLSVVPGPNIIRKDIRNSKDAKGSALDQVEKLFWQLADRKEEWTKEVNTVVIDSLTELLTLTLEDIVKERGGSPDTLWMQDYGKSTPALKRLMRYFRDLPINVIVTALAQDVMEGKGESAVRVAVEPDLTKKLRESMKGLLDNIWYLYRKDDGNSDTYHMLTRTRGLYFGKTRGQYFAPALGARVDNPNLPEIYELLLKSEGQYRK